jgi:gamma-glutamylcyclotransferase (GGCT)/AIG2-like uncharacterized protein YtfP
MQHVFVYGTLRAGEINDINRAAARHGIAAPKLIGSAYVSGRLFDFGNYPGLVLEEESVHASRVLGDIYLIEDALVPVLDEIEEVYPGVDGLFSAHRLHVEADLQNGRTHIDCLIYPVSAETVIGLPRIDSGDWVAHRAARDA